MQQTHSPRPAGIHICLELSQTVLKHRIRVKVLVLFQTVTVPQDPLDVKQHARRRRLAQFDDCFDSRSFLAFFGEWIEKVPTKDAFLFRRDRELQIGLEYGPCRFMQKLNVTPLNGAARLPEGHGSCV